MLKVTHLKYVILFCPDSGSSPGEQAVTEEFRLDWDGVLVGSEQVIVARLDGRGSGFRGERYMRFQSFPSVIITNIS